MKTVQCLSVVVIILVVVSDTFCWPEGTYGIPMPGSGCPHTSEYKFTWQHGSRTQKTSAGSYAEDNCHLAGITATKIKQSDRITQNFCVKTIQFAASDYTFDKGSYCIYKKGKCPGGMLTGSVEWDDDVPFFAFDDSVQSFTGTLPDGTFDRDTKIEFCCRADGSTTKPINLPTEFDFYLLRLGNQCQKVEGMDVSEEWVQWAGKHGFDRDIGTHPLTSRTPAYIRMYYCYYTKELVNPTLKIVLFCAIGIICFVVLVAMLIFIIRRLTACICDKARTRRRDTPITEPSGTAQPMLGDRGVVVRSRGEKVPLQELEEARPMPTAPPDDSRPLSLPPTYEESFAHKVI